mmetsp:Transcript_18931/g.45211  ORF Transcript_18931/g.45211 Transcript_18931/m.45211 type:complete len:206 (-) Transcript_18931:702-1319(-)
MSLCWGLRASSPQLGEEHSDSNPCIALFRATRSSTPIADRCTPCCPRMPGRTPAWTKRLRHCPAPSTAVARRFRSSLPRGCEGRSIAIQRCIPRTATGVCGPPPASGEAAAGILLSSAIVLSSALLTYRKSPWMFMSSWLPRRRMTSPPANMASALRRSKRPTTARLSGPRSTRSPVCTTTSWPARQCSPSSMTPQRVRALTAWS